MGIRFHANYSGRLRFQKTLKPPADPQAPEWFTGSGYVTTFAEGDTVDYPLIASDPNDDIYDYSVSGGELPPGIELNMFSGHLMGKVGQVTGDTSYDFTITVTDWSGLSSSRSFEILIKDIKTQVTWQTPEGLVGDPAPGEMVTTPLEAVSE